jgi:hypothetical protein
VLRRTPAPASEIHALDPVDAVAGELRVRSDGPVTISLADDGGRRWEVSLRPALDGRGRVDASVDGEPMGAGVQLREGFASAPLAIRFESGQAGVTAEGEGVVARLPDVSGGDLSITAARGSEARVELGGLRLGDR